MHHLMPVPASLTWQDGSLRLSGPWTIATDGFSDARLSAAVDRAAARLEARTGLRRADSGTVVLRVQAQAGGNALPQLGEDESYSLEVSSSGAVLKAPTGTGVLRGLETFLQLVDKDGSGFYLPAARITDRPRFPWRGLLIDACRHWEPVEIIKRNLDAMAAYKLNVLHWHLSEDQGFRVESKKLPKLQQMGSDGLFYTQDQIREVIAYAAARGIRVLPEFDMPGHITAWLVGYPEMGSTPGPYQIERKFGVFDPALDPTREEVYQFVDTFIGEMTDLFPDAYFHVGGDEVTGKPWQRDKRIQAFMQEKGMKDWHDLQAYFNQRVSKIVEQHGKKMVGWDEVLHPELPKSIVVQSWRGASSLADGARQGYQGILSAGYYLDHIRSAGYHYQKDPLPADSTLSAEEAARILGGESCQWGEHVGPETIESRIWPRNAAIAERFWSPREVTDVKEMYRRLDAQEEELRMLGVTQAHERLLERLVSPPPKKSKSKTPPAPPKALAPMRALQEVMEPVSFSMRIKIQRPTQETPLTNLVDVARPDSRAAREFAARVDEYLSSPRPELREQLRRTLTAWSQIQKSLNQAPNPTPLVKQARQAARQLTLLCDTGLKALGKQKSNWRNKQAAWLTSAGRPGPAAVEFATLLPALRKLVETPAP